MRSHLIAEVFKRSIRGDACLIFRHGRARIARYAYISILADITRGEGEGLEPRLRQEPTFQCRVSHDESKAYPRARDFSIACIIRSCARARDLVFHNASGTNLTFSRRAIEHASSSLPRERDNLRAIGRPLENRIYRK